jgi:hypothetical protein
MCPSVAYPGILFGGGGSTNSAEVRGQRERGSGGSGPLVRGSGDSCNLVFFLGGGFEPPQTTPFGTPLVSMISVFTRQVYVGQNMNIKPHFQEYIITVLACSLKYQFIVHTYALQDVCENRLANTSILLGK